MKSKDLFGQLLIDKTTIIFDMDGLLVNTEPLWKRAEKSVFGRLGLVLTDEDLRQVMGFRLNEVVNYWYQYQPWDNPDLIATENHILDEMEYLIRSEATTLPGVIPLLSYLKSKRKYTIALASSSPMRLIQAVLETCSIKPYFDIVHSAEFESYGKPHPAVFITTAQLANTTYDHCIVLEDSVNGVIAAKAARMTCIAVPEEAMYTHPVFAIADLKLSSLTELSE